MDRIAWANKQPLLKKGFQDKLRLFSFPASRLAGFWHGLDGWSRIIHAGASLILACLVLSAWGAFSNALGKPRPGAALFWKGQAMAAPPRSLLCTLPSLGVNSHLDTMVDNQRRAELSRLAGMGATWVRGSAPWYALQPETERFDPVQLDRLRRMVMGATAAGMHMLVLGDQAPDWAGGGDDTASHPEAYGTFMGSLASALRGLGPGGSSPAFELMNEPNGLMAKGGRTWAAPADYARSACAAYRAIHAADPGATVVAGSLDLSALQAMPQWCPNLL